MVIIKPISREEFESSHFNRRYWDENGGRPDKRPAWFDLDSGHSGKVTRIYVSATWHPTWAEWKPEADRALTAAVMEFDFFRGIYEQRGSSYPIVAEPRYLLQKNHVIRDQLDIWVNVCCPDSAEFERTLAEAKARIEDQSRPLIGMRSASFNEPLPMLPIDSVWCQDKAVNSDVAELLASL